MKIKDLRNAILKIPKRELLKPNLVGLKTDNTNRLYYLILSGKVKSESDAKKLIYPNNKYPNRILWKTKETLVNRFINSLTVSNISSLVGYAKLIVNSSKNILSFNILNQIGLKKFAIQFAKRGLEFASKNDLSRDKLFFALELRLYFGIVDPSLKDYETYNEIVESSLKNYNAECKLESYVAFMALYINPKTHVEEEQLNKFKEFEQETIKILSNKNVSAKCYHYGYVVLSDYYLLIKDFESAITISRKAIEFLQKSPLSSSPVVLFQFKYIICLVLILERKYDQVYRNVINTLQLLNPPHFFARAQILLLKIHCNLHEGNYEAAYQNAMAIDANFEVINERLAIYRAYASALTKRPYKVGKFINEQQLSAKDKKGLNINVLILEVLGYLIHGSFDKIIEKMAGIERYKYRYLNEELTFRSYHFFNLLLSLEKGSFNREQVALVAEKDLKALRSLPLIESKQDFEVEVVPYEDLWVFILGLLP